MACTSPAAMGGIGLQVSVTPARCLTKLDTPHRGTKKEGRTAATQRRVAAGVTGDEQTGLQLFLRSEPCSWIQLDSFSKLNSKSSPRLTPETLRCSILQLRYAACFACSELVSMQANIATPLSCMTPFAIPPTTQIGLP